MTTEQTQPAAYAYAPAEQNQGAYREPVIATAVSIDSLIEAQNDACSPSLAEEGRTVATMVSIDSLIEAQNDAVEAMCAATRALFEHAKATRVYVTVRNPRTREMPTTGLLLEVKPYWASLGHVAVHYEEITEISHDGERDILEVTIS